MQSMMKKIELSFEKHEATEQVDNWEMSFSVGVYYGDKTFEQNEVFTIN